MELNEVRFGAAYIARHMQANPRELIIKIIEQYNGSTKAEQFQHFRAMIAEDAEYQMAVDWYFFTNMHDYVTTNRSSKKGGGRARNVSGEVEAARDRVIRAVLTLNFIMPNGHKLGDCTGTEVAKFGGIFTAIGKKAGKQLVGKVFTSDKQIQAIK